MPISKIGQSLPFDRKGETLFLKSKGEKVRLRFIGGYSYEGNHWIEESDGKDRPHDCVRINKEEECAMCNDFFEKLKEAKKIEDETLRKKSMDSIKQKYAPQVSYYYPAINRLTEESVIFKTTLTVRLYLDKEVEDGYDVSKFDYSIERTEKPGSYYEIKREESTMTKPLTEKELKNIKEAESWDLNEIAQGKKGTGNMSEVSFKTPVDQPDEQSNDDEVLPDDIPF